MYKISIIIPTYADNDRTVKLVKTLLSIESSENIHEIIVVDNNEYPELSFDFDRKCVNLVHCTTPGSYSARNFGVQVSTGEYLVFTDSDCEPKNDWIKNILSTIESNSYEVVAGVTKISQQNSKKWAFLFEKVVAFNFDNMKNNEVATTSNLIVKRELLEQFPFNENSFSGGDVEWTKTHSKNNDIYYSEEIVVFHPARKSILEIMRKDERVYGGFFKRENRVKLFFSNFILPITQFKLILESDENLLDKIGLLLLSCFFRAARFSYHLKLITTGKFRR